MKAVEMGYKVKGKNPAEKHEIEMKRKFRHLTDEELEDEINASREADRS